MPYENKGRKHIYYIPILNAIINRYPTILKHITWKTKESSPGKTTARNTEKSPGNTMEIHCISSILT